MKRKGKEWEPGSRKFSQRREMKRIPLPTNTEPHRRLEWASITGLPDWAEKIARDQIVKDRATEPELLEKLGMPPNLIAASLQSHQEEDAQYGDISSRPVTLAWFGEVHFRQFPGSSVMALDLVGIRGATLFDILCADIQFTDDLSLAIEEGRFTADHLQKTPPKDRQKNFELLKKALKDLKAKFGSE
jgi:hypothetical protein